MDVAVHRREFLGPTILWIHGYTMDSSVWEDLWDALPGWRHVGVDLPGHGGSADSPLPSSLPNLGRLVSDVAAQEHARHLVGISFGSMIALQAAIQSPDQFRSLILGSTAIGGGAQDPFAQQRNIELIDLYRARGAGLWMTELWWSSPPDIFLGASKHPDLRSRLRTVIDRHSWSELGGNSMPALCSHRQPTSDLKRVRSRTLILLGEDDMVVFKRNAELVRSAIPGTRRVYMQNAGHLCLLEYPSESAALIRAHLLAAEYESDSISSARETSLPRVRTAP